MSSDIDASSLYARPQAGHASQEKPLVQNQGRSTQAPLRKTGKNALAPLSEQDSDVFSAQPLEKGHSSTPQELRAARHTIDTIDHALVELLGKRFSCTRQIGLLKAHAHLPVHDPLREEEQKATLETLAKQQGLDCAFVQQLFAFIKEKVREENRRIATEIDTPPFETGLSPL